MEDLLQIGACLDGNMVYRWEKVNPGFPDIRLRKPWIWGQENAVSYKIVLIMHDEIIVETREESVDEVQGIIEEFRGGVSENHSWDAV